METTAPPPSGRKEDLAQELQILVATYTAPQRLRSHHKAKVKRIISLKQGQDGKVAYCYFCKRLGNCDVDMQVHHLDHVESHNQLSNLEIAHQICNNVENQKYRQTIMRAERQRLSMPASVCARDQTTVATPHDNERTVTQEAAQWSAKEGAKHDAQRYVWNRWITDLEKGPFKGINTSLYPSALAELAPWGLGRYVGMAEPLGSSVTYRRFIREDVKGGILREDTDDLGKTVLLLNYTPETEKAN